MKIVFCFTQKLLAVARVFEWNACTSISMRPRSPSMRPSSITFVWKAVLLVSATAMLGSTALTLRRGGRLVAASSTASTSSCCFIARQLRKTGSNTGAFSRIRRKSTMAGTVPNHFEDAALVYSEQQGAVKPSEIETLEAKITELNGGQPINCNSRKQVSKAVFDCKQSASREMLEKATKDPEVSPHRQQIAELVLKVRSLSSKPRTSRQQNNSNKDTQHQMRSINGDTGSLPSQSSATIQCDDDGLSSYERQIENLFLSHNNKIDPYWKDILLGLTTHSAQKLVAQLRPTCPFGFSRDVDPKDPTADVVPSKKGKQNFVDFCRKQKEKYSNCVILCRCGDFYEVHGIDAILLVEYCGLNSMGGKAKAGCPKGNVHATLADLTNANFQIAVFEESAPANSGKVKGQEIKERFLTQMVTPAQPTYIYNNCMSTTGAEDLSRVRVARPYIGVISTQAGYTVVEISMEERTARISERMTSEAVACLLSTSAPVDPLLYVPSESEISSGPSAAPVPQFVPTHRGLSGGVSQLRIHRINPTVVQQEGGGISNIDRAKNVILSELLRVTKINDDDVDNAASIGRKRLSAEDFTVVQQSNMHSVHPLHLETATQLGLTDNQAIPSIISHILPTAAPNAVKDFIRRKLLVPPPPPEGDSMREIVRFFWQERRALPPFAVPNTGKILSVLRIGEASAEDYSELLRVMSFLKAFLDLIDKEDTVKNSLMTLIAFETGMSTTVQSLKDRCVEATQVIEEVLCPSHHARKNTSKYNDLDASSFGNAIPDDFFHRNEDTWRGRVRRDMVPEAYDKVEEEASKLATVVANDFWNKKLDEEIPVAEDFWYKKFKGKSPVLHDLINNDICVKDIPSEASSKTCYIAFIDRANKKDSNKKTTERVQNAVTNYKTACEEAHKAVSEALSRLSEQLVDKGHVPAIVQASHANLILSAAFHHASKANFLGWAIADVYDYSSDEPSAGHFKNLWPYWMKRSAVDTVTNTFDLEGMWMLTGT